MPLGEFRPAAGIIIVKKVDQSNKPPIDYLPKEPPVTLFYPSEEREVEHEAYGIYEVIDSGDLAIDGQQLVILNSHVQEFEHKQDKILFVKASLISLVRNAWGDHED